VKRNTIAPTALLIGLIVLPHASVAQTPARSSGHWEGAIEIPGQPLAVQVDLSGDGKKWEGTITIPAQNLKGFPLDGVVITGDDVTFLMPRVPGEPRFKGTLSKDGTSLSGDFTQGGGTVPFALKRTGDAKIEPALKSTPLTADLQGDWEATLDVNGKLLRLILRLSTQPDGTGGGTLVSVDQGGVEIPVQAVIQTGEHLKVLVPPIAGTYEGDLKDGQLIGTWTQGPGTWPLTFKRSK
jgi:uncharacterized protein